MHRQVLLIAAWLMGGTASQGSTIMEYTVTDLSTLGGTWSYGAGINNTGTVTVPGTSTRASLA
jgi:hypothetical protein